MNVDIKALNDRIHAESEFLERIRQEIGQVIVGQEFMVERMLIGLLANGHILLEGVPGLAKTLLIKTLAQTIRTDFQRLQFTPDLLPADIVGTQIFDQKTGDFIPKPGPIFSHLILADEINRAPAKVQSALLEAMQERQVTIGERTFPLEEPFLVMATQNPIEQEGTYPLPEAQVDRFMLKIKITYPTRQEETEIVRRWARGRSPQVQPVASVEEILRARGLLHEIYMDEKIEAYIVNLVCATRAPGEFGLADLADLIHFGASPRATIYLALAAKAHAFLRRRGYVTPEDVRALAMDVLRHRVLVTYEAEAEEVTPEDVVRKILDQVEVP